MMNSKRFKDYNQIIIMLLFCGIHVNQLIILLCTFISLQHSLYLSIFFALTYIKFHKIMLFETLINSFLISFFFHIALTKRFAFDDLYVHFIDSMASITYLSYISHKNKDFLYLIKVSLSFLIFPYSYKFFHIDIHFPVEVFVTIFIFGLFLGFFFLHSQEQATFDRKIIKDNERLVQIFYELLLNFLSPFDTSILYFLSGKEVKSQTKAACIDKQLNILDDQYIYPVKDGILAAFQFGVGDTNNYVLDPGDNKCGFWPMNELIADYGFLRTFFKGCQLFIIKDPNFYAPKRSRTYSAFCHDNKPFFRSTNPHFPGVNNKKHPYNDEVLKALLELAGKISKIIPESVKFKASIMYGNYSIVCYGKDMCSFTINGNVVDKALNMLSYCKFGEIIIPKSIVHTFLRKADFNVVQRNMEVIYYVSSWDNYRKNLSEHFKNRGIEKLVAYDIDISYNKGGEIINLNQSLLLDLFEVILKYSAESDRPNEFPLSYYMKILHQHKTSIGNYFVSVKVNLFQFVLIFVILFYLVFNPECCQMSVLHVFLFLFVIFLFHLFIFLQKSQAVSQSFDTIIELCHSLFLPILILINAIKLDKLSNSYLASILYVPILFVKQSSVSILLRNKLKLERNKLIIMFFATILFFGLCIFVMIFYLNFHLYFSIISLTSFCYSFLLLIFQFDQYFQKIEAQEQQLKKIEQKTYKYLPKNLFIDTFFQPLLNCTSTNERIFSRSILFIIRLKIISDEYEDDDLKNNSKTNDFTDINFIFYKIVQEELRNYKSIISLGPHGNHWFFCSTFQNFTDANFFETYPNVLVHETLIFFEIYESLMFQMNLKTKIKQKIKNYSIEYISMNVVSETIYTLFFGSNTVPMFFSNGWSTCLDLLSMQKDCSGIFVSTDFVKFFQHNYLLLKSSFHKAATTESKIDLLKFLKDSQVPLSKFAFDQYFHFSNVPVILFRNDLYSISEMFTSENQ
eukprot:TRINITY_DN7024_c0_g1_i1.p1 TRINITY_DN7024_c0_g1~~TRINITY_DN7024_c0_g1_i1.p1  ORF type:complete len:966 (+),score=194.30 TRINITY_DN7024_c0_g1_i1:366-3263(+)